MSFRNLLVHNLELLGISWRVRCQQLVPEAAAKSETGALAKWEGVRGKNSGRGAGNVEEEIGNVADVAIY